MAAFTPFTRRVALAHVAALAALTLYGLVNAQIKLIRLPSGERTEIPGYEQNTTLYASITGFCEAEGFVWKWDVVTGKLSCTSGRAKAVFSQDNPFYLINDSLFQAPCAAVRRDESLYLPVKVLVHCFRALENETIEWNPQDTSITVSAVPSRQGVSQAKEAKSKRDVHDSVIEAVNAGEIIKTVVIDPGHGGKDPGAIGPDGTREKDIVLSIGVKLGDLFKKKSVFRSS